MARRRRYGVVHSTTKVQRAQPYYAKSRSRKLSVGVTVSRAPTGHFHAIACVRGMKAGYLGKGSHCSGLRGGVSPSKAAGHALEELGQSIVRYGR